MFYLTRIASAYGIRGVEPAGGINLDNIKQISDGVKGIDIEFFMPHLFGSSIDPKTDETIPAIVKKIYETVRDLWWNSLAYKSCSVKKLRLDLNVETQ